MKTPNIVISAYKIKEILSIVKKFIKTTPCEFGDIIQKINCKLKFLKWKPVYEVTDEYAMALVLYMKNYNIERKQKQKWKYKNVKEEHI